MTGYAFGDTDLARQRLGIVADTFASPTRALLADLPPGGRRYVLDLGCGPGYTAALLREAFPFAFITGLDGSEAMCAEARTRVPDADFFTADVTQPLRLPAHLVYARLLLGHLPEPRRPSARAPSVFWRNAVSWNGDPAMIDELRALEAEGSGDVLWEIRQTVWVKNSA